jgi:DNA-binding SARP family transcriptional activator
MTNRGKWEEAKTLRRQAHELRQEGPDPANLDVRVLLRTGRLAQARATLEKRAAEERKYPDRFREPRAHRETLLLLSLTYAWQGKAQEAMACAQQGIEIGRRLESPFIEAVGYMRLGHAWGIAGHPQAARQAMNCYRRAIDIGEQLAVARTKVEALWGLCRLHGFGGDLTAAERTAHEAIEIGLTAGDEWIAAHVGTMLGASYVMAGRHDDAERWLGHSAEAAVECGDPFGQAIALLWLCLLYRSQGAKKMIAHLRKLLSLVQTHNYDFLLERQTFLGPPDPPALVPLLIAAKRNGIETAYAGRTLETWELPPTLAFHPGYTLRVQTLGRFQVQRGRATVGADEWHREKARSLFQLLVANRGRFLQRDEIAAALWPEANADTAEGQFKVTLNTLQGVLEPQRPPRAPTLFVQRRGSSYGLNPAAPLWIDAAVFEEWVAQANSEPNEGRKRELLQQALTLYEGDFLPKCLYEDWCRQERERLRRLYLNAALQTAELLLAGDEADQVAHLCQQILTVDECLEPAYQLLIRAHLRRGDRVQALRAYERCEACLRQELDMTPAQETVALIRQVRKSQTK